MRIIFTVSVSSSAGALLPSSVAALPGFLSSVAGSAAALLSLPPTASVSVVSIADIATGATWLASSARLLLEQRPRALGGGAALAGSMGVLLSCAVDCGKAPAPALLAGIEANVTAAAFASAMGASVVSILSADTGLPTQSFQVTVLPLGFVGPSTSGASAPGSPGVAGAIGGGAAGAALLALAAAAWLAYSRRRKGRAGGDESAVPASQQSLGFKVDNPHARSASLRGGVGAASGVAAQGGGAAPAPRAAPPAAVVRRVPFADVAAATNGFAAARRIGAGATGEVFRGLLEGAPAAVKLLKLPPQASDEQREQLRARFRAELETLRRFAGHPRVARLRGFAIDEAAASPRPFALVLELLEEGSLADHLRSAAGAAPQKPPLTALERVDAALGAAQGLAFLHGLRDESAVGEGYADAADAKRVVHRDVKSANIGLTRHNGALFAKLLDCGVAKAMRPPGEDGGSGGSGGAASFSSGVLGTAGYMAPEVADGLYTVRSEVYSFGVVLLELLTGRVAAPGWAATIRRAGSTQWVRNRVGDSTPAQESKSISASAPASTCADK